MQTRAMGHVFVSAVGLAALVCVGLACVGLVVAMEEVHLSMDQVPEAVRDTILREAGDGRITEVEMETKGDAVVYEAEFVRDGWEIEVAVAPDGTLLGREVERHVDGTRGLTLEQIPQRAAQALRSLAGDAPIHEVEREYSRGATVYEATWSRDGVTHEAVVTADGALMESEETVSANDTPAVVLAAIANHFPADAKVTVARKMVVLYEAEASVDGREKELVVLPTGHMIQDRDDGEDDDGDDDDGEDDDEEDDDGEKGED